MYIKTYSVVFVFFFVIPGVTTAGENSRQSFPRTIPPPPANFTTKTIVPPLLSTIYMYGVVPLFLCFFQTQYAVSRSQVGRSFFQTQYAVSRSQVGRKADFE